jgi:hypothetical protein
MTATLARAVNSVGSCSRGVGARRKRRPKAANLHQCTDAKNTAQNLPLFATFRRARQSSRAEASRRMSNQHWRIGTCLSVVGRFQKKKWHGRAAKWHKSTPLLFTMSRGRAEGGDQVYEYEHEDENEQDSRRGRSLVTLVGRMTGIRTNAMRISLAAVAVSVRRSCVDRYNRHLRVVGLHGVSVNSRFCGEERPSPRPSHTEKGEGGDRVQSSF